MHLYLNQVYRLHLDTTISVDTQSRPTADFLPSQASDNCKELLSKKKKFCLQRVTWTHLDFYKRRCGGYTLLTDLLSLSSSVCSGEKWSVKQGKSELWTAEKPFPKELGWQNSQLTTNWSALFAGEMRVLFFRLSKQTSLRLQEAEEIWITGVE